MNVWDHDQLKADMARASLRTAQQCLENDNYDGADANFQDALNAAPDLPEARLEYGYFLMRAGRAGEGAGDRTSGVTVTPFFPSEGD